MKRLVAVAVVALTLVGCGEQAMASVTETLSEVATLTAEPTEVTAEETEEAKTDTDLIAVASAKVERMATKELLFLGYSAEKLYDRTIALTDGEVVRHVYRFTNQRSGHVVFTSAIYTMAERAFARYGFDASAYKDIEKSVKKKYGIDLCLTAERSGSIIAVPYISQEGVLPNGCEAVSATMLLNHCGLEITASEFVDSYLPRQDVLKDGENVYGPDSSTVYTGDPYSEDGGYGCYSPVIVGALNKALEGTGTEAVDLTGSTMAELCEVIDGGTPVIVWGTLYMSHEAVWIKWKSPNGEAEYSYPSNEHCLLLVGYDDEHYYFNDPYMTTGLIGYEKSQVESVYASVGMQAVTVKAK